MAFIEVFAGDRAFQRARVPARRQFSFLTGSGARGTHAHFDFGVFIRFAQRINAHNARLRTKRRHPDLRHAALRTHSIQRFDFALRQRVRYIALRPASAPDEHALALRGRAHLQVLAAFRTRANVRIGSNSIFQRIFYFFFVSQQLFELFGKKVARSCHHGIFRLLTSNNVIHARFKIGRHFRVRDMRRKLFQRVANSHAQLGWLNRIILDVLHRVEALNNGMARGLRAQVELFHFLNKLALAVARGRLRLLLRAFRTAECNNLVCGKRGQLLIFLHAIRVNLAITR